jgi:(p)ppGpp synthase/HD superfamily hydrolase
LAMLYYDKINVDLGIVGLIHNVFELSDYTKDFISEKFGEKISNQVSNLTVNRNLQWNEDYKNAYYEKIMNGPREARIIKIIDKLDNLFILGVNPDKQVKIKYLKEIEKHVLPLAYKTTPKIYSYMKELVDDNYKSGFNIG